MGRLYQILPPLFSIFLVRVDLTDLFPLSYEVQVVKIYDGDTILVRRGVRRMKIRLSKIDSPEKTQKFFHDEKDAGEVSKLCLERVLKREKKLFLYIEKEDLYGRYLGDLNQLSFKLVEAGCTTLYPYAQFASEKEKFRYLHALKKAKARRVGLWRYGGFLQPKLWRKFNKRSVVRR